MQELFYEMSVNMLLLQKSDKLAAMHAKRKKHANQPLRIRAAGASEHAHEIGERGDRFEPRVLEPSKSIDDDGANTYTSSAFAVGFG